MESSEPPINLEDWRDYAACRGLDPNMFFPIGNVGQSIEQIEQAKDVCRTCVAQIACLEYALKTNQDNGIWGGTDEIERRKIRKQWISRNRSA